MIGTNKDQPRCVDGKGIRIVDLQHLERHLELRGGSRAAADGSPPFSASSVNHGPSRS